MVNQTELFGDPYIPFDHGLPEGYPKNQFKPLHPLFTRKGKVVSGHLAKREFYVDLSIGECVCQDGEAFRYYDNRKSADKWADHRYCTHKLRMMSAIVEGSDLVGDKRRLLVRAYLDALGTRYNPFEVASAFHKELRRGDFERAWFWGLILTTKRGMRGLFRYLRDIIYEETRDHELAEFLLKCCTSDRMQTLSSACQAIGWFCATPKKWQLPRRYAIFNSEMEGYDRLVKEYGRDVAKGSNIIPIDQRAKLLKALQDGVKQNDHVLFQFGLKGLQKLQYMDEADPQLSRNDKDGLRIQQHRRWMYERLYELCEAKWGDTNDGWLIVSYINGRVAADLGIGYHELNAMADALMGEPIDAGILGPVKRKIQTARPVPAPPLYLWPPIPLYAADNHTWDGKRRIAKFPEQLKPGAEQTDLDLRYCGAYFGVAYRMVSYKQHDRVADWNETEWPTRLYNIVQKLWY